MFFCQTRRTSEKKENSRRIKRFQSYLFYSFERLKGASEKRIMFGRYFLRQPCHCHIILKLLFFSSFSVFIQNLFCLCYGDPFPALSYVYAARKKMKRKKDKRRLDNIVSTFKKCQCIPAFSACLYSISFIQFFLLGFDHKVFS